jgi:hypothetical protein
MAVTYMNQTLMRAAVMNTLALKWALAIYAANVRLGFPMQTPQNMWTLIVNQENVSWL